MTLNERRSLPLWKKILAYLISISILLLQIALLVVVFRYFINFSGEMYQSIVSIIYIIIEIVAIILVFYIANLDISINYKLTWAILILAFPIIFGTIYILNSTSRTFSNYKQRKIKKEFGEYKFENIKIDNTLANNINNAIAQYPLYKNVNAKFYNDAKYKFIDMVEDIKNAKSFILFEYFIISNGKLMDELIPILETKSNEGVKIFMLYDDVGSKGILAHKLVKRLGAIKNLTINNYQPLGINMNLLINYRDHRKICVIDGVIAYVGGDNLADEYIHLEERFGYWRDNAIRYIGDVAEGFTNLFIQMWYVSTKHNITNELNIIKYDNIESNALVSIFGDGPSIKGQPGYDAFKSIIMSAEKYLYISTPYFIIDDSLRDLITLKAKSGVEVILLMPKIPDKKTIFYLGRENYRKLLENNAQIYEYTLGFNHAKNIIVDNKVAFIGTINMDYRSLFLHYECGSILFESDEIIKMKDDFLDALAKSELITMEKWKKRKFYQRAIAFILNIIAPFF